MLDFCRLKIEGDIEANVKKMIAAKVISYRFTKDQKYNLNQIRTTLPKWDLQSPTIYQINGNSIRIKMHFSELR